MGGAEEKLREMVTGDKAPGEGGVSLMRLQIHRGGVGSENTMQAWIGMGDVAAPQPDEAQNLDLITFVQQRIFMISPHSESENNFKW